MTQGYGVGSHAPAAVWGGVDIAVDGDGDGNADPQGSMGAPLYATMSGVIELKENSMPAGNHLWIKNDRYKVGYGHLQSFAVQDGQMVKRGDLIAYMGSTGNSSGPHLHYHIWQDGVNVNPLDFGAMP
jgi:murein DD-endopeptidase MepM/ murein hydrolase activator NlpD